MLDLKNLNSALDQLAEDKGISKEKILETIEIALAAAYKKEYGKKTQIIRAEFDPKTGKAKFWQVKLVVDETMIKSEKEIAAELAESLVAQGNQASQPKSFSFGGEAEKEIVKEAAREALMEEVETTADGEIKKVRFNPERHTMIDEAKKIKKGVSPGDELTFSLETKDDYGRIAAQTAKQVILQKLREEERNSIYEEYAEKQGEVISVLVQRVEGKIVFLDLGRSIGILPPEEQVRGERYRQNERIKVLVLSVEKTSKGPSIRLSRSHPVLVKKLFEIEVPEIASGVVEIKNIAREPGSRTKIAVASNEENIDPVGSCVGQKGVRVSTIIAELGGEKIDIVPWSDNPEKSIESSLSPAKILEVDVDKENRAAKVMVAEDQLSLAIGKGGQNVRLAAKLTGYKIDIRSRSGETIAEAESDSVEADTKGKIKI